MTKSIVYSADKQHDMSTLTAILTSIFFINAPTQKSHFELTDNFFSKYVENGRVDYEALVSNPQDLNLLYDQISEMELSGKSPEFVKAFYINAYNILVIKQVVDLYPIKSPLENGKFFNAIKHTVAGKKLTLDGIEKTTLLKTYPDPRIHFAVVCAAVGCPPIHNKAFTPENVESLLTERTTNAMNSEYFTRVSGKKVELSEIFNWYNKDFVTKDQRLIDFVNQFRDEKIPLSAQVSYYKYDWNLNIK